MKDIRYGRLVVTLLLIAYSLWVAFGSRSRRETPYEHRVRVLREELKQLDEDAPDRAALETRLEEARREAERNSPEMLAQRVGQLEEELAGTTPGSDEHRTLRNRIANLRRQIPSWYDRLPLNLGLDLRGGTEVRMRIVSEELERRRDLLADKRDAAEAALRELTPGTPEFAEQQEALKTIETDLGEAQSSLDSNIQDAVKVIRNRLDRQGMASIQVMKEGANRIRVELPGMDSSTAQTVINTIKVAGRLEFRIVTDLQKEAVTADMWNEMKHKVDPNTKNICLELGRVLEPNEIDEHGLSKEGGYRLYDYLREPAVVGPDGEIQQPAQDHLVEQDPRPLTGQHIRSARSSMDPNNPGFFTVNIRFDLEGGNRFARLTRDNVGRRLAIILDGELRSAPVVREPILNGRCEISGNFSEGEASELAVILKEGSLPVDLEVEMQNNVGASLGEDSIARGMQAIVVGLVLVLAFMAIYYRFAGLITDLGLAINMLFILAILVMFDAVLTLPGIAGLILTVGMAVDANVLIFERIREELRKGSGLARAIENGYDRAFVTIVDANVTTFITALILLTFGTATVKGFATTLTIGIITSMFVSLY
ncbi:MAG: protein translocase subunit SecD, partial [Planctomycetota bacterium]